MNYLLDTNACIALMSSSANAVQARFARNARKEGRFFTSAVVAFELWYGVYKSARRAENTARCEVFLSGPIDMLPFEAADAGLAGEIRAALESSGRPIGAYDLLLASQALRHNMVLVTANVGEFSRVKELEWEDWSK